MLGGERAIFLTWICSCQLLGRVAIAIATSTRPALLVADSLVLAAVRQPQGSVTHGDPAGRHR